MTISFRVTPHGIRPGVQVAEVLLNGEMVAAIYPDGVNGIKLVSAHMEKVTQSDGVGDIPPIPDIRITFDPQPYTIEGGRIIRHPRS